MRGFSVEPPHDMLELMLCCHPCCARGIGLPDNTDCMPPASVTGRPLALFSDRSLAEWGIIFTEMISFVITAVTGTKGASRYQAC